MRIPGIRSQSAPTAMEWIILLLATTIVLLTTSAQDASQNIMFHHPGFRVHRPLNFISTPAQNMPSAKVATKQLNVDRTLPCCKDESGGSVCRAMKNNDPRGFSSKCAQEPDFSLVVCCKSCNELGTNYRDRAAHFFNPSNNATNCFDRMSASYCSRFQASSDMWVNKRWSCDTEHFRLGFRVCRATCGFCQLDWKNAREVEKCMKH